MSSTLAQGAAGVPNYLSGSSPGRLERRVLSEERGKCYSPRPFCGYSRATPRDASHYLNCRRCQPSQSTDPHQPAFALGSPDDVGYWRLGGGGGEAKRHEEDLRATEEAQRKLRSFLDRNMIGSYYNQFVAEGINSKQDLIQIEMSDFIEMGISKIKSKKLLRIIAKEVHNR